MINVFKYHFKNKKLYYDQIIIKLILFDKQDQNLWKQKFIWSLIKLSNKIVLRTIELPLRSMGMWMMITFDK